MQASAVTDKLTQLAALWRTCCKHVSLDTKCDKLVTELSWQCFTSKVANLQPAFGTSVEGTPFEFCQDFRHQTTRVPGLSCGILCVFLCLAVSVEDWLVTDGRTNRQTWQQLIPMLPSIVQVKTVKLTHFYHSTGIYATCNKKNHRIRILFNCDYYFWCFSD